MPQVKARTMTRWDEAMNRRAFLKFFGIGVPAAAVAVVVAPKLMESKTVEAKLGEWNNYYSEGDPELMESICLWRGQNGETHPVTEIYYDREMIQRLKFENRELFIKLASRNDLHIGAPVSREFFQYNVKP